MNSFPGPLSVLVMENTQSYRSEILQGLCDEAGVLLISLPPYSPDFSRSWIRLQVSIETCVSIRVWESGLGSLGMKWEVQAYSRRIIQLCRLEVAHVAGVLIRHT